MVYLHCIVIIDQETARDCWINVEEWVDLKVSQSIITNPIIFFPALKYTFESLMALF